MPPAPCRPLFIGHDIYRRSTYGASHPLAIPRVSTCIDLCRALGWLPEAAYWESPRATPEQLVRFHHPDYVAALMAAEAEGRIPPDVRLRHNIGVNGNPLFPEIFSRPATAAGGSLLAARLLGSPGIVYHPAGGTHHGRPDRASGFCFLNDPVLAILALLDQGIARVLYLDVDAHHGDGVQDAFNGDRRVLTVSIHEAGRWPMAGIDPWRGPGSVADRADGTARNFPVPAGLNDDEFAFVLEEGIWPLAAAFAPDVVVLQCGADALAEDPLSRLELSNGALWRVVARTRTLADRVLVLGGGGYNPWSVGRCWAGVWATLNGLTIPDRLPTEAEAILRTIAWRHRLGRNPPEHWFTTLADPPRHGPIREEIRRMVVAART